MNLLLQFVMYYTTILLYYYTTILLYNIQFNWAKMNPFVFILASTLLLSHTNSQLSQSTSDKPYRQYLLDVENQDGTASRKIYDVAFCQSYAYILTSLQDNKQISIIKATQQNGQLKKSQQSSELTLFSKGNAEKAHIMCSAHQMIIQNIAQQKNQFLRPKFQSLYFPLSSTDLTIEQTLQRESIQTQASNQHYFLIQTETQVQNPNNPNKNENTISEKVQMIYHIWYSSKQQKIMIAHKVLPKQKIGHQQQQQQNSLKRQQQYQTQWGVKSINSPLNVKDIKAETKSFTKVHLNKNYICMTFQFQQKSLKQLLIQCYDIKTLSQIQDNKIMLQQSFLYDIKMTQQNMLYYYTYQPSQVQNRPDSDDLVVYSINPDKIKKVLQQKTQQTPMKLQRSIQISAGQKYIATFNGLNLKIFQAIKDLSLADQQSKSLKLIKQIQLQLPQQNKPDVKNYTNIRFGSGVLDAKTNKTQSESLFIFDQQFKSYMQVFLDTKTDHPDEVIPASQAQIEVNKTNPIKEIQHRNLTTQSENQTVVVPIIQSNQSINQSTQPSIANQQATQTTSKNSSDANSVPVGQNQSSKPQSQASSLGPVQTLPTNNNSNNIAQSSAKSNSSIDTPQSPVNADSPTKLITQNNNQSLIRQSQQRQRQAQKNKSDSDDSSKTQTNKSSLNLSTQSSYTPGATKLSDTTGSSSTTNGSDIGSQKVTNTQNNQIPNQKDKNNTQYNQVSNQANKSQHNTSQPNKSLSNTSLPNTSESLSTPAPLANVSASSPNTSLPSPNTQPDTNKPIEESKIDDSKQQPSSIINLQLMKKDEQLRQKENALNIQQQRLSTLKAELEEKQKQIYFYYSQKEKSILQIKQKQNQNEKRLQKVMQKQKEVGLLQQNLNTQSQEIKKRFQDVQSQQQRLKEHQLQIKNKEDGLKKLQEQYNLKTQAVLEDLKTIIAQSKHSNISEANVKKIQQTKIQPQKSAPSSPQQQKAGPSSETKTKTDSTHKKPNEHTIQLSNQQQQQLVNHKKKEQKKQKPVKAQQQFDDDIYFLALGGICILIVIAWFLIKKRNSSAPNKASNKMSSFSSNSGGLALQTDSEKGKLQKGQSSTKQNTNNRNLTQIRLNTSQQLDDNLQITINDNDDQFQQATYVKEIKDDQSNLI